MAIDSEGRIVVAASTLPLANEFFSAIRYNPDGSLDQSFGNGGVVTTDVDANGSVADLFIYPDGRILLVVGRARITLSWSNTARMGRSIRHSVLAAS
ncbi:MAG: hypothetical protein IPM46_08855 [Flavobacteriales bacterium]|nr:hypothetical protein [Flavobacteriales bacterium]